MMRYVSRIALALVLSCFLLKPAEAVEQSALVRASIIEKIAEFIEWPNWVGDHFSLCAYDNSALLPALEIYYANSDFHNKAIKLVGFNNFNSLLECQVIYLGEYETRYLESILKVTKGHPILIVSEKKDIVSQGAHVGFFVEDSRLNLEVNRIALEKSHLKASYHLLGVARVVE